MNKIITGLVGGAIGFFIGQYIAGTSEIGQAGLLILPTSVIGFFIGLSMGD